jgi:hypothetical protein
MAQAVIFGNLSAEKSLYPNLVNKKVFVVCLRSSYYIALASIKLAMWLRLVWN